MANARPAARRTEQTEVRRDHRSSLFPVVTASGTAGAKRVAGGDVSSTRTRGATGEPTGFVVDDFSAWSAIPAGYRAEGVQLSGGAITLSDGNTSHSRVGMLASPPLELWRPALAAPVENPVPLPDGCDIRTQISLSADGKTWGPWIPVERHTPPDGHQALPAGPPTWSGSRPLREFPGATDGDTSGPRIRYRLTLTSQSAANPVVKDLRIWRNQNSHSIN